MKCQHANPRPIRDSWAHGAQTADAPSRTGFGLEIGRHGNGRSWPVFSAISRCATPRLALTPITGDTKRFDVTRLLQRIRTPLLSDVGIRYMRSGGFGTYTLRVIATGFRLAARESGSEESRAMQANFALEPAAAGPSVSGCGGRFVAPWLRRRSVSGGCGSAFRYMVAKLR